MRMLKTLIDWTLRVAGVLALAVLALHWSDADYGRRVKPPTGMATLEDFRRWQPEREEAVRIDSNGVIYYLVRGEKGRTLASGPAGYLFDARGNFVGWSRDLGDDHQIAMTADGRGKRTAVRLAEIGGRK